MNVLWPQSRSRFLVTAVGAFNTIPTDTIIPNYFCLSLSICLEPRLFGASTQMFLVGTFLLSFSTFFFFLSPRGSDDRAESKSFARLLARMKL